MLLIKKTAGKIKQIRENAIPTYTLSAVYERSRLAKNFLC